MKLGMVGLPNVGKSTLFNAITNAGAESANYAFCTIDPNIGIAKVPDHRLEALSELYNPEKFRYATIEMVDIAGLVRGASKGEGRGNAFLADIRGVDAIIHVVRCFEDENIIHVDDDIDALRDIETINIELVLSDIEIAKRRLDKSLKAAKGDKTLSKEVDYLERLMDHLEGGNSARGFFEDEYEEGILDEMNLLSGKPIIYAANMSEDDFIGGIEENEEYQKVKALAEEEGAAVLPVCAKLEEDIADMSDEEKTMFLAEVNLTESGLDRLIKASYELLGLVSYLTAGEKEVRAWTITKGTKAPGAAGKIHTDFERGFIRAEIVHYEDLIATGSWANAREVGKVRMEGKEYVVKDGDIILFHFNV